MAFLTQAVSLILVVVLSIHIINGQSVLDRCKCPQPSTKSIKWKIIEEFSVIAQRSRCKAEIILTLKTNEREQRCLSPDIYQGKYLQECWNRVNKDNSKAVIKIMECTTGKNTTVKTDNPTPASLK